MRSLFGLCAALTVEGLAAVTVLTTDTAGPATGDRLTTLSGVVHEAYGYPVYYCRKDIGADVSTELFRRIPRLVSETDCIHLTGVYSFPTLPVLAWARYYHKPVVWSPRGSLQPWDGRRRSGIKKVYNHVAALTGDTRRILLHVTSEAECNDSRAAFPRLRCAVVPNGIDIPAHPAQRTSLPDPRRLLFVGRLHPAKALERLIDALMLLPDHTVHVYGGGESGYVSALKDRAREAGVIGRFVLHGVLPEEEKDTVFADAGICVVPSHSENFGLVVAEALAHGVPVVASTGTPWQGLEEHGCGRWVENTPESLAAALRDLCHADLTEMGARGRAWMLDEFTWKSAAEKMAKVYTTHLADCNTLDAVSR